jgi:hypothetical protein
MNAKSPWMNRDFFHQRLYIEPKIHAYYKYDLTQDETAFIESMVRPMSADDEEKIEESADD